MHPPVFAGAARRPSSFSANWGAILAAIALTCGSGAAHSQSGVSVSISLLPAASVVAVLSATAPGFSKFVTEIPAALSESAASLVVNTAQSTAEGVVYGLQRISDGAQATIAVSGAGASRMAVATGTILRTTVLATGTLLSSEGRTVAFVPNDEGRALLHNESLSTARAQ